VLSRRISEDQPGVHLEGRGTGNKTGLVPIVCVLGIVGNLLTLVVLTYERVRTGAGAERKVRH